MLMLQDQNTLEVFHSIGQYQIICSAIKQNESAVDGIQFSFF